MGGTNTPIADWYDCLGSKVPQERRAVAEEHLMDMGMEDPRERTELLDHVCQHIEHDRPEKALEVAADAVGLSGAYRLSAALCVDPSSPKYTTSWEWHDVGMNTGDAAVGANQ